MSENTPIHCSNCGALPEHTVPVWENVEDAEMGEDPDYLGCTQCHTMTRYVQMYHRPREDFKCINCGFVEEDIVYEARPDYCPNCGKTNPWRPTHV